MAPIGEEEDINMFGDIQSENEDDFVMPPFSGVEPIYNESPEQDDVNEDESPRKQS